MTQTTIPALVIRRTYDAAPQQVYAAWTQPDLAKQFLCPNDVKVDEIRMDVRVGGSYKIVMLMPDGERWTVTGFYKEVRPARRLSMTWRWLEGDPADERDTLLSIDFNANGSGTELVLTHDGFAGEESRNSHERGWSSILENLGAALR